MSWSSKLEPSLPSDAVPTIAALDAAIVGDADSGKSTVFRRLEGEWMEYAPPASLSFRQTAHLLVQEGDRKVHVKLHDYTRDALSSFLCEGREDVNPFDADLFVLTISAASEPDAATRALTCWLKAILESCPRLRPAFVLVMTMLDKECSHRETTIQRCETWASGRGVPVIRTSHDSKHGALSTAASQFVLDVVVSPAVAASVSRGYLTKRGSVFKTWKRRWFVLDSNELTYFETPGGRQLGSIMLLGATLVNPTTCKQVFPKTTTMDHALVVQTAQRTFYLVAESRDEQLAWVAAIERALSPQ
eukprot:m.35022 g.35022  ORF g.35022 m.35022 type:complete len:304 (+) comp9841_c0_seq3:758-1669(+)